MKNSSMTIYILSALVLGVAVGWFINISFGNDPEVIKCMVGYLDLVPFGFLRLIQMVIAPLVFSTLVMGISHMAGSCGLGRIGLKTMSWFIGASLISLALGLILVNLFKPGVDLNMSLPDVTMVSDVKPASISLKGFVEHMIPNSFAEAMAKNQILAIVVFSLFFGVGVGAAGDKAKHLLHVIEGLAEVIMKVTGYVMNVAPLAVFAAIASAIAVKGLIILKTYAFFMGDFYISMGILWLVLILAGLVFIGPLIFKLLSMVRSPILLAFSTASSEAAYPKILESLERFGVSPKIASFVLPMGYSFNLDGSMIYCTFASIFIAQAYSINLNIRDQITMMLVLMLTSKGMAGVPRASLVVIAGTLAQFHIPEAGLLLLIGIDQFLDMGRSATNVIGNSIAAAVIANLEGEWDQDVARKSLENYDKELPDIS